MAAPEKNEITQQELSPVDQLVRDGNAKIAAATAANAEIERQLAELAEEKASRIAAHDAAMADLKTQEMALRAERLSNNNAIGSIQRMLRHSVSIPKPRKPKPAADTPPADEADQNDAPPNDETDEAYEGDPIAGEIDDVPPEQRPAPPAPEQRPAPSEPKQRTSFRVIPKQDADPSAGE